jgi:hypothetical protein
MVPLRIALGGVKAVTGLPQRGKVATVTALDPLGVGERGWPQPIEVQRISQNGRYLILSLTEYVAEQESRYVKKQTLRAIDLKQGKIWDLATTKPNVVPFGWQWFDLSQGA